MTRYDIDLAVKLADVALAIPEAVNEVYVTQQLARYVRGMAPLARIHAEEGQSV